MKDYTAIFDELRLKEEELIAGYLSNCYVARIKYDVIVFEMPMYIPIEPTFHIPGYEYIGMDMPEPEIPQMDKILYEEFLPPLTLYTNYLYKNSRTGNTVTVSVSDKKLYDKKDVPYTSLRARFRSENKNVTLINIYEFLFYIYKQYCYRINNIRGYNCTLEKPIDEALLHSCPFYIYYAEPCIDIGGPTESINYLHQKCSSNLYVTRCKKREQYSKNNNHKEKRGDRILRDRNKTEYISDKTRAYKYEKGGGHYFRFELRFDKDYLRRKGVRLPEEYRDKFHPYKFWQERCFFCIFNLPKIAKRIHKIAPEQVYSIMAFITETQTKENGEEYTVFEKAEKLMEYKINGNKLFKSAKELFVPKWIVLYNLIHESLKQLSLTEPPDMNVEIQSVTPAMFDNRKTRTRKQIMAAINRLQQRGEKVNYSNVMREAGIKSRATISRNSDLLK